MNRLRFLPLSELPSFRTRVAIGFGLLAAAVTALLSVVAGSMVGERLAREQGEYLRMVAVSVSALLADGVAERMNDLELLAATPEVAARGLDPSRWNELLHQLHAQNPSFAWIGVTGIDGRVRAATGGLLVGADVGSREWFRRGRSGAFTGDVHPAQLLATLLPSSAPGEPPRFIDFATPLRDPAGSVIGVLAAHGHWSWARDVIGQVQRDTGARGVRVFILDRRGAVILRPDGEGASLQPPGTLADEPALQVWSDGERYLTVHAPMLPRSPVTDLGWTVVVQQPAEAALASAMAARHAMLAVGALIALAAAAVGWWSAGRYARPLERMAQAAQRIERGDLEVAIPAGGPARELEQLSSALNAMTRRLVAREHALEEANRTLESRVEERTAELERANEELDRLARRDALTGLHNRRSADERLLDEIARVRRHGRPLSALVVDVDCFKRINDQHGHEAGDAVLRELAQRLPRMLRATDFVARQGGEEFLVLLPATGAPQAHEVAEKLRRAIALEPVEPVGTVTASIGVATLTPQMEAVSDPVALLRRADDALYAAKRGGRNRVAVAG
ncbi:sensor domain-containing diguanylate cyclase [Caldimonas sp. KR1-144]|uniref:sensor domain-containing diguanylate cyclase n=1 Tax=Caldimonas sp. KR1-144 TaxID=3400911 RepID=UPI003C0F761F